MPDDTQKVAIRTANGFYVTAINGGGMGEDANALPIHTDAVVVQDWERFRVFFNTDGTCNNPDYRALFPDRSKRWRDPGAGE